MRGCAIGRQKSKDAKPQPNHLIAAGQASVFLDDGPTSKLIGQVLGAGAERKQMRGAQVTCREAARGRRGGEAALSGRLSASGNAFHDPGSPLASTNSAPLY